MSTAVSPLAVPFTPTTAHLTAEAAFDRCAAAIHRYVLVRVGGDTHLADDFMQQLWLHAQRLTGSPADELEFRLRAIAKNLLRTRWRQLKQRPAHVPLPDPQRAADLARRLVTEQLPAALLEQRETRDQLLLALTELRGAHQELIIEHYFHGRSHAALAAHFGASERAIEGRLYRARLALREKLEHLESF